MKKLFLVFNDGSKITYTMKNDTSFIPYFNRHKGSNMKSAILQQYPKKDYAPVDLLENK